MLEKSYRNSGHVLFNIHISDSSLMTKLGWTFFSNNLELIPCLVRRWWSNLDLDLNLARHRGQVMLTSGSNPCTCLKCRIALGLQDSSLEHFKQHHLCPLPEGAIPSSWGVWTVILSDLNSEITKSFWIRIISVCFYKPSTYFGLFL